MLCGLGGVVGVPPSLSDRLIAISKVGELPSPNAPSLTPCMLVQSVDIVVTSFYDNFEIWYICVCFWFIDSRRNTASSECSQNVSGPTRGHDKIGMAVVRQKRIIKIIKRLRTYKYIDHTPVMASKSRDFCLGTGTIGIIPSIIPTDNSLGQYLYAV